MASPLERLRPTDVTTPQRLLAAGATRAQLRAAVASGRIIAAGRSRLVRSDAPPEVRRAAQLGGVVACLSAAKLLGLWVIDDGRLHIAVAEDRGLTRASLMPQEKIHWTSSAIEPAPLDAGVEGPREMLRHVARCQPPERAVVILDSAVRTKLISLDELQRVGAHVGGSMRRTAQLANDLADSGLETLMRLGLAARGIPCRQQVVIEGRPVDALVGQRLVIQCDGFGPHSDPAQRHRDLEQDRRLRLRGYTVFRFDYGSIVHDLDGCTAQIAAAIAQGLHLADGARP